MELFRYIIQVIVRLLATPLMLLLCLVLWVFAISQDKYLALYVVDHPSQPKGGGEGGSKVIDRNAMMRAVMQNGKV